MGSDAVCAAWRSLANRCPTNFGVVAYWGWLEAIPSLYRYQGGKALDTLPEQRRKNVLQAIRMLEKVAGQGDRAAAAGACEALSILRYMVTMEAEGAMADMRRAVELDPSREQAWDGLTVYSISRQNWPELIRVCEQRIKARDTARGRVLLAKALEKNGQINKALEASERALTLDKESPLAQLAVAALLVRTSRDNEGLQRAIKLLQKTGERLHDLSSNEQTRVLTKTYIVNAAILYALSGQKADARDILKRWDEVFPGDPDGKELVDEIALVIGKG
jgi:tetratricopeptide (TPR) repeat protein